MLYLLAMLFLGDAAQAGEWKAQQIGRLDTLIYHPTESQHSTSQHSLMISLHGCSQTPEDLRQHGNWESAADLGDMVVALPRVPQGGVILGCWDYFGGNHSETGRHDGDLIELTQKLIHDPELRIDPSRVYISGLSSGGTQALVMACLRPDLFSGVGLSSSPGVGTELGDLRKTRLDLNAAMRNCLAMAGERKAHFAHQSVAIITSDQDFMVNPAHSALNRDVLRKLYGADQETSIDPKNLPGARTDGEAHYYSTTNGSSQQYRVAFIINRGIGHGWPAGQGGATTHYIVKNSVNFPEFLVRFFNKRSDEQAMKR